MPSTPLMSISHVLNELEAASESRLVLEGPDPDIDVRIRVFRPAGRPRGSEGNVVAPCFGSQEIDAGSAMT